MRSVLFGFVAAFAASSIFLASTDARADTITGTGTWSGEIFGNSTVITGVFTWDPTNFLFDAGGPSGHEYWYSCANVVCSGITVSNSPIPSDNGTYPLSAYDIFLVDSANADPTVALTSPDLEMMLLPNGTVPSAPNNYGFGGMVTPGSQPTLFNGFVGTPVPEPSAFVLLATGALGLAGIALRRRAQA